MGRRYVGLGSQGIYSQWGVIGVFLSRSNMARSVIEQDVLDSEKEWRGPVGAGRAVRRLIQRPRREKMRPGWDSEVAEMVLSD